MSNISIKGIGGGIGSARMRDIEFKSKLGEMFRVDEGIIDVPEKSFARVMRGVTAVNEKAKRLSRTAWSATAAVHTAKSGSEGIRLQKAAAEAHSEAGAYRRKHAMDWEADHHVIMTRYHKGQRRD